MRIFQSELDLIGHETSTHLSIETGGSLYGLWTVGGNPTIMLATRPGPGAIRQQYQFEQDLQLHRDLDHRLLELHGIQGIGLWHSHHGIGLHELSGGDLKRTMRFAERNNRPWFCDLLCYFTDGGREVAVKPYVYVDAPQGEHVPTQLVVLPGVSPVRTALQAGSGPMPGALTAAPSGAAPPLKHEQSTGHLSGRSEDAPGLLQRFLGRKEKPAEIPASRMEIPDLESYLHTYLEPALASAPTGVRCEMATTNGGKWVRLTMRSPSREAVEVHLGWDGQTPVAFSLVATVRGHAPRQELLDGPRNLSEAVEAGYQILTQSRRR
ncbi:hypothetical protein [Dactylosporangium sp. NPDC051541]|uniref:hypothetical protein n=1 Tax=Dactylosporangium sp. NPDC051541 TaxID=3363977 RepID=UPI0037991CFE